MLIFSSDDASRAIGHPGCEQVMQLLWHRHKVACRLRPLLHWADPGLFGMLRYRCSCRDLLLCCSLACTHAPVGMGVY